MKQVPVPSSAPTAAVPAVQEVRRFDKYPNLVMKTPQTAHSFAKNIFENEGEKFKNNPLTNTDWCHIHVAVIVKRNKILAEACNQVGSRHMGCGYSDRSIHAERAVVKKLGNTDLLRGADMYIFRNGRTEQSRYSQPCQACEVFIKKCMREYGLRYAFYSI
jgi:hypothetical protein